MNKVKLFFFSGKGQQHNNNNNRLVSVLVHVLIYNRGRGGDPPQKSPPEAGTKKKEGGGQTESKGRVFCIHAIFSPRHILSSILGRGIISLDCEKVNNKYTVLSCKGQEQRYKSTIMIP